MSLLEYLRTNPVELVDLGQPWHVGMPSSPTHPSFRSELTARHDDDGRRNDGLTGAAERFETGSHVGTHVDALCHVAVNGRLHDGRSIEVIDGRHVHGGIEEFALKIRRALLVDVPGLRGVDRLEPGEAVTADDLDESDVEVRPGDAVLVRTGWAQLWDEQEAYVGLSTGAPGLDVSAALWLTKRSVGLVGSDTLAVEQITLEHGHGRLPVHRILLAEHGVNLLEVMNLERLGAEREFAFACFPLNIQGATGAPVRPVALIDERANR
jgi:kynurenine formamidase